MGIMDKIKFWKRDNEMSLDSNPFGQTDSLGNDPLAKNTDPFAINKEPIGLNDALHTKPPESRLDDPLSAENIIRSGKISEPAEVKGDVHPNQTMMAKDIEILSSKLDAIKSNIESMSQRIIHIENIATKEEEKYKY